MANNRKNVLAQRNVLKWSTGRNCSTQIIARYIPRRIDNFKDSQALIPNIVIKRNAKRIVQQALTQLWGLQDQRDPWGLAHLICCHWDVCHTKQLWDKSMKYCPNKLIMLTERQMTSGLLNDTRPTISPNLSNTGGKIANCAAHYNIHFSLLHLCSTSPNKLSHHFEARVKFLESRSPNSQTKKIDG